LARTQENRQAELITPLGTDALLFHHLVAQEGISQLFEYELIVFSEDENIVLDDLLGQHAHVELELPEGETRYFSGHVTRFSFLGFRGPLAKYKLELKPWLWFLTRAVNNRVFQNESVPEIIKKVCADHGFTDIDDRLTCSYEAREFCVQYRESDFAFISRLMESEGIYYYFAHEPGKHNLTLADSISAHEPFGDYAIVPYFPPDQHDHRERDHIDAWQVSRAVRSGKIALRDYNFTTPSANMEVKAQMIRDYEHAALEQYDYPGDYAGHGQGERLARLRLEAEQADMEVLRGGGNARGMVPGFLFKLEDYPREDQNREYLILSVTHDVLNDEYDADASSTESGFNYCCSIVAMPSNEPFRAPHHTPRPIVHGPQTGVVVGKSGDEIWTDEYGRVKVQFHWDREGAKDENSSCWIRVSHGWAGKKWGMQFLPRIGHEVVIEFLEGDPDRPLVTGSVYNAENMPPYDLPDKATQSGIKTRSSKGGTSSNYNEIRFEDKKDAEKLAIHAEKDMDVTIENDNLISVGNDRTETVQHDETVDIKRNRTHTVDGDDKRHVKGDDDERVDGGQDVTVKGSRTFKVEGNENRNIDGLQSETIGRKWTKTAIGGISINSPTNIDITSGTQISLTDENSVHFGKFDLNFQGMTVGITGQTTDLKGNAIGLVAVNVGVNGVNIGFNGVDISKNGVEVTMKDVKLLMEKISLKKLEMKMQKKAMEIVMGALNIRKSGFTSLM